MVMILPAAKKPVVFIASARDDLRRLPKPVSYVFATPSCWRNLATNTRTQSPEGVRGSGCA